MLLGGETLARPRSIRWIFVASSTGRIEAAKQALRESDWQDGRIRLLPSDSAEFIALAER